MNEHPVSGPHDDNAVTPSVNAFLDTDQHNLEDTRHHRPEFRELVPPLNALYDRAGELIPRASDLAFGRALLLCNKALLSAAALIGRGHPEDAGAVTRRAIEIATTSLAIKYDPRNLDRWLAEKEREARRLARSKGERPKPIDSSRIRWPCKHRLLDSLRMENARPPRRMLRPGVLAR